MACAATRRTQDADGSSWVLHGHHVISVSTTRERDEGGGCGCGCGWVRAAADGVRTFPRPGHMSPGYGFRERVHDSDISGHGAAEVKS